MPLKDPEAKKAYQRWWYAEHRDRVIAKVMRRKKEDYAGVCVNCGGPTVGQTKGKAPRYCGKNECRKALWREKRDGRKGRTNDSGRQAKKKSKHRLSGRADD